MKKLFLFVLLTFNIILFSESKHNGYKIDTTLAYDQDFNLKPGDVLAKGGTISIGFMPEWKQEINTTQDITFGVKTSATLGLAVKKFPKSNIIEVSNNSLDETEGKEDESADIYYYPHGSINLTGIVDFNYLINDKMKGYIGIEAGMGVNFLSTQETIHILEAGSEPPIIKTHTEVAFELGPIIKGALGVKINDKYNIGIFGGYGNKGLAGIEMGYKF